MVKSKKFTFPGQSFPTLLSNLEPIKFKRHNSKGYDACNVMKVDKKNCKVDHILKMKLKYTSMTTNMNLANIYLSQKKIMN